MSLLDIRLFVALDHELVQHNEIVAEQRLDGPRTQPFDRLALLVDPHQSISTSDAVHPLRVLWAADIQIPLSDPLLTFTFVEDRSEQRQGTFLGRSRTTGSLVFSTPGASPHLLKKREYTEQKQ